jgi:ABC-2 type transport system permease protein
MQAALTLWNKEMAKSMRNSMEMIGMLIQPVLWIALFGVGMGSLLGGGMPGSGMDDPGNSYISFMLPGIIALTAAGGSIAGGATWLNDRLRGIIKEYLAAPIPRLSILMGNALSITSKGLLQSVVILLVGILFGASLNASLPGILGGLLLVVGYTLGFAGIAIMFASQSDSPGAYHMMIMIFNLPLLFLSNALYPLGTMPGWMRVLSLINPTTYIVTGLRYTLLDLSPGQVQALGIPLWLCFLVVAAFAVLGMGLGYRAFVQSIR